MDGSALLVGFIPALGLVIEVLDSISRALQHFAAGLLLSAVGCELLPTLLDASGWRENLFATIGFTAGMGILIISESLLPEHCNNGDVNQNHDNQTKLSDRSSMFRSRRLSKTFYDIATGQRTLRSNITSRRETVRAIHSQSRNRNSSSNPNEDSS